MATAAETRTKRAAEAAHLAELVSLLDDPSEESLISRASDYLATARTEEEFNNKTKAWHAFLVSMKNENREINANSAKIGMAIYRKTRHLPSYFVGDQKLSLDMLGELDVVVDFWLTLDLKNDLSPLLEKVGRNYSYYPSSPATLLRAYMDAHKQERGFKIWTMDHMISLQYKVYQVVQEKVGQGKRSQSSVELPATKRQKVIGANVTVAKLSKLVEKPPQERNCASAPESSSSLEQNILATFPNALKVEQSYQSSKATYQCTENTWQEATEKISAAQSKFHNASYVVIDGVDEHLQVMCRHAKSGWTLALARESLKEFQARRKVLENYFEEYIEPLEIEQQAKEDYDVARAKFLEFEKKRAVVEQAMKAIQSLKDL